MLAAWRGLGCTFLVALTAIDMEATLEGHDAFVAEATASAREILTGLRANAYLARLDEMRSRRTLTIAPGDGRVRLTGALPVP